jgi:hypothetical protein
VFTNVTGLGSASYPHPFPLEEWSAPCGLLGKRAKKTPVDESNNGHGTDQNSSNVQIPRDGGDTDKIITIKQ